MQSKIVRKAAMNQMRQSENLHENEGMFNDNINDLF